MVKNPPDTPAMREVKETQEIKETWVRSLCREAPLE